MTTAPNISDKISIAVLPFVNMSASEENEYFSDGITEEIINALAQIDRLKVSSRTSAFYFKGKNIPISEIGNALGVSTILEGSVRLSGNNIRITAQLIDAVEDFHFWSESWDRQLDNIFEVQDEISLLVAERLREHLGHFEIQEHLVVPNTQSVDAYKLFLKGRQTFNKWNPEGVRQSMEFYRKALEIDAHHAESMVGLAGAYSFLATIGTIPYAEGWGKCSELIQNALTIDDKLPSAYYQLANLAFYTRGSYSEAFENAAKAVRIDPNYVESRHLMSFLHILAGEKSEAKKHLSHALSIDPLSQETQFYNAYIEYMSENYASSINQLDACLEVNPMNVPVHSVKAYCLLKTERYDEVIRYFDALPTQIVVAAEKIGLSALAYALKGDSVNTEKFTELLEQRANGIDDFAADSYLFLLAASTGNSNKAFAFVENTLKSPSPLLLMRYSDPLVNAIKADPRYSNFHQKLFPAELFELKGAPVDKKPMLDATAAADLKARLEQLIETSKPYLNPELTLRSLADQLETNANQLSWLLNDTIGRNFNSFVNQYRIEEFKKIAKDPGNDNFTIEGLAYNCGFNSKTVFNTYFKQATGLTPSEFLKA